VNYTEIATLNNLGFQFYNFTLKGDDVILSQYLIGPVILNTNQNQTLYHELLEREAALPFLSEFPQADM
jgi:hypothetical protein